jgi:hypothetical protein
MPSFFKEKNKILATHKTENVRLVFTMGKGILKNHYKLTAYVNGSKVMISDKEFLPSVYMEKELFLEYSRLMHGSTFTLIERLKASCRSKEDTMYRMALILEHDSRALQKKFYKT